MSQPLSALLEDGQGTPQPDRAYRLLVAQRLAEVVEAVHAAGGAIGNLDDRRVLVAPDGTVTLSDDAGTAALAYTAPELQGLFMGRPRPEGQHDAFALAVLLFHLLMEGHHPYAGRWVGGGNLPDIPKAIQLGLYAYGGSSAVTPPPDAPALSTLEPGLADLFKRSFAATSATFRTRPSGADWAQVLAAARQMAEATPPLMTGQPAPLPEPASGPAAHPPVAVVAPAAPTQAPSEAAPEEPPLNPELPAHEPWPPTPTTPPDLPPRLRPEAIASPVKRTVARRALPPRAVVPADPSGEPARLAGSDRSWSSFWRDLLSELDAWRQVIAALAVFLLFLITLVFVARDDDWANPRSRPAVGRATRVPATQTPQPRPTVTRVSIVNPTVASFGNNFDISDRVIPSTGERFSAYVRQRALHLEVFGRGARGQAMFNAAPAQGDFAFTVHVGETTGQGEILIYLSAREPDSGRTWVFALDPGASTWGLYEERPTSGRLKVVIARQNYSRAIARQPLRTVSVTRKGERISLRINDIPINPQIARAMPEITGPVQAGVGAMIPDEPDYADEPFVVTVDRVAMSADEG